jgi:triacylglycerol lipase
MMGLLGWRLRIAGYRVLNPKYPSTSEPLEDLVARLAVIVSRCEGKVHFVGHSLGGIIVRAYLDQLDRPFDGRVVMLSPPNQGSEIVDAFQKSPLLTRLLGPVGAKLGTDPESIPSSLGPAHFEVGIITGTRSVNLIGSLIIPGPHDGSVSVARAQLEGAAAFKVTGGTHTFLMNRRDVARDVISFLQEGRFGRSSETSTT